MIVNDSPIFGIGHLKTMVPELIRNKKNLDRDNRFRILRLLCMGTSAHNLYINYHNSRNSSGQ